MENWRAWWAVLEELISIELWFWWMKCDVQGREVALEAGGGWIRRVVVGPQNEGGLIDGTFGRLRGPMAFSGPKKGM